MRWNRGLASWLLSLLILSGIAALFLLPVLLTATILPNSGAVRLPELPPPLDPVADALEVQELLETTYLGRGNEVPDPGEPAVVLRKYLEQNAHGYQQLLAKEELKLDSEMRAWQELVRRFPQSRHALVALAKHYRTKAQVSGDIGYIRQATDAYMKAAEIGLANGRIRYTRELSELLVTLGDHKGLDDIFVQMLAQSKDTDRDSYYLALVDYAEGLTRFSDERAWAYFEQAIGLHSENPEEAINLYAKSLLERGQARTALTVLDTHLTSEQRVRAIVPAFLRQQAMEQAGMDIASAEAEIALIRQRMVDGGPLAGYSPNSDDQALIVAATNQPDDNIAALFAPGAAFAQVPEPTISSVFPVSTNNTIWEGQLYAEGTLGTIVQFDAGPAKKIAAAQFPNSKRGGLARIATDGRVYYRHFNGKEWGSWIDLGVPAQGVKALDIAAVARSTSQNDIFLVDIFIVSDNNGWVYRRQSSNNGTSWNNWSDFICCATEVAVAASPNGTLHVAAKANGSPNNSVWITRFVNNTWVWTDLGPPLAQTTLDLTLLASANGGVTVWVAASNCWIFHWNFDGTTWTGPGVWASACYKNVSSFPTSDGGAYLLYLGTTNSALYTQRFTGTSWGGILQRTVQPWLAVAGAEFEPDKDPPFEHDVFYDDCRQANQTCYLDPNVPNMCFRAHTLNLAEILYNEARAEAIGAQAMVGWTVRDRAYMGANNNANNDKLSCDAYPGGNTICATPCNDPFFCESSKRYCCVMHGGTTIVGTPQSQFNDEHVPFSTLYNSGFTYRAVHILNGFIPDPSTGFVPSGVSGCNTHNPPD